MCPATNEPAHRRKQEEYEGKRRIDIGPEEPGRQADVCRGRRPELGDLRGDHQPQPHAEGDELSREIATRE